MLEDKELRSDVKRILFYLENDDRTGKPGLVKEVSLISENQKATDKRFIDFLAEYRQEQAVKKRDMKWAVAIWTSITTAGLFIVKTLVGVFLK